MHPKLKVSISVGFIMVRAATDFQLPGYLQMPDRGLVAPEPTLCSCLLVFSALPRSHGPACFTTALRVLCF